MRKRRDFIHSIFFKFSLAFLTVGLIPLFVLGMLAINQSTEQVERHTVNKFAQTMLFVSKNVEDIFNEYNEISKTIYVSSDMVNSMQQTAPAKQDMHDNLSVRASLIDNYLKSTLYTNRNIQSTFFRRASDRQLFKQTRSSRVFNENEPFPLISWDYILQTQPKKMAVFPPHLEMYYGSDRQVLTFARNLIDTSGRAEQDPQVMGTLYMDVSVDVLDNLFRQVELGEQDEVYLVDGRGNILYSNRSDRLGQRFDDYAVRRSGEMLIFTEPVPFVNGKVVGLISKSGMFAPIHQITFKVAFTAGICLLVLLLIGFWFSRRFTNPIVEMIRHMQKVESGNLETSMTVVSRDEMGRLAEGFNVMVTRLKLFIQNAYVAEIKHKQAELNALKSQIRPHYLYNTLEVIRMSAVANDDEQVADMIHALSNQLKYVIDYGEEWVTARREFEHLRHYFHLIEVRFDYRIELRMDIRDEELLDRFILKMSVQPLVENAVQHGVRPKGGKGIVMVTLERTDDDELVITIYDNGIGMSEEKLTRLREHLADGKGSTGKSIGLKNVHARIRTVCGDHYGVMVQSNPNLGTSVTMVFPLKKEEQEDEKHSSINSG
ncbi:cache domain-containing sensor histidine kinase [Paenibacillus maysiensis]|uniref:cache domain-containing sensor histidine kinase n=1 Tax=Paenibacillus maysiensis TaxID=1155954 RepID=UPI00047274AA|nr:sensor histidine kinase [Paenibacillus maysiensis]